MRLPKPKATGFTLIEVLIAMVILALAFSTSFVSLSSAANHLITLQDKTAANWVAMNVIAKAQLQIIAIPQQAGSTNGTEKMFDKDWYWTLNVSSSGYPTMVRVNVNVSKSEGGANVSQITSYILNKPQT